MLVDCQKFFSSYSFSCAPPILIPRVLLENSGGMYRSHRSLSPYTSDECDPWSCWRFQGRIFPSTGLELSIFNRWSIFPSFFWVKSLMQLFFSYVVRFVVMLPQISCRDSFWCRLYHKGKSSITHKLEVPMVCWLGPSFWYVLFWERWWDSFVYCEK